MDGVSVQTVVVGSMLMEEAWEDELFRLPARLNASFSSVLHVSSLVVEEEGRLADFLLKNVCGECPVIINHVDYAAVLEVILKASQKTFGRMEPNSVLDHLQAQLRSASWTACMNKLLNLRAVSIR